MLYNIPHNLFCDDIFRLQSYTGIINMFNICYKLLNFDLQCIMLYLIILNFSVEPENQMCPKKSGQFSDTARKI